MTVTFRHRLARLIKATYDWLPLAGGTKRAVKGWLFGAFPAVFGDTNAYHRWRMHDAGVALPAAPAVQLPAASEPRGSGLHRRLLEEMAARAAAPSSGHAGYVATDESLAPPLTVSARAIAFYLPQFHPIAENDAWWGRGFTEWTNVGKALPQFAGHDQPRLPGELGYYDLRVPEVMARQVELARRYGVHGFAFHYYWFAGRRLLERPLDQFVGSGIDFPFCICWANENWTRRWDGYDQDVLIGQEHSDANDEHFIADLAPLLRDQRYIRIDGRPLLIVYRPSLLPDARHTAEHWRRYCREHGVGEIMLGMVQFDIDDPAAFGFDVAIEFPPHKLARGLPHCHDQLEFQCSDYRGYVVDYGRLVDTAVQWPVPEYPMFRGVFPGWDNEARKPGAGYTFHGATPARYREWLSEAIGHAARHPVQGERVVFINAWNEWAEGAYLEPDRRHGYAFLQATRDALTGPPVVPHLKATVPTGTTARVPRIAVVSHDAHPHGAQYLALHLVRELDALGQDTCAVLLGDGVLAEEFERAVPVYRAARDAASLAALARTLVEQGVTHAIANTAVSGDCTAAFAEAGIETIALVHELPGVVRQYGLEPQLASIARHARHVVFAADAVRDGFREFEPLPGERVVIRAQGLYKRNRFAPSRIDEARAQLRARLAIPGDAQVVLCVGYADLRKGVDLFVEAGRAVMAANPRAHFVWVGHPDLSIEDDVRRAVQATGHAERFHFVGRQSDTDAYYAGADVYALTSREDPYPSVVMEAFDAGVPVVAFRGSGGSVALLEKLGGALAPAEDAAAFAAQVALLLDDAPHRARLGAAGRAFVVEHRDFRHYAFDLLDLLGVRLPRVSVVVPNYNYARYLEARIRSVAAQTVPPFEIIVLDDGSSDDSLAELERVRGCVRAPLRVVASEHNSGSVFRQWLAGAQLARGDYLWIAEADDLADLRLLERALEGFADRAVVMSMVQSRQIDADGLELAPDYLDYVDAFGRARWEGAFTASLDEELAHGLAVKNTIPNVSAVVFRRHVFVQVLKRHLEDIASYRIAGDWLLYVRLLEHGRLAFHPAALNAHRRHGGSVTLGGSQVPHLLEVMRMQRQIAADHPVAQAADAAVGDYATFLYAHFGLDEGGRLRIEHDDRFAPLLPASVRRRHGRGEALSQAVAVVAEAWEDSTYYDDAEQHTPLFWDGPRNAFRALFDRMDLSRTAELACGHGRHAERAAPLCGHLTLLDIHAANLAHCRRRLAAHPHLDYLLTSGSDLQPLGDRSLTALYCYDAMVHFDPLVVEAYLEDIARVLEPGGMALLHHSNYPHANPLHYGGNPHCRNAMTLERMAALAAAAGLDVVEQRTYSWGEIPELDGITLLRRRGGA